MLGLEVSTQPDLQSEKPYCTCSASCDNKVEKGPAFILVSSHPVWVRVRVLMVRYLREKAGGSLKGMGSVLSSFPECSTTPRLVQKLTVCYPEFGGQLGRQSIKSYGLHIDVGVDRVYVGMV